MAIFGPRANLFMNVALLATAGGLVFLAILIWVAPVMGYNSQERYTPPQPVPFSHKHHVSGLGLDCRYCHTTVEISQNAGVPPTYTCMTCHSQIWTNAQILAPVRDSYRTGRPLEWTRVHDLPDFVYFNHSIHVNKGIGCVSCHGRVDRMPLTWQVNTLYMRWCLDCHRNPERHLRPKDQVFNMDYEEPPDQAVVGARLAKEYGIPNVQKMTDCVTCHR